MTILYIDIDVIGVLNTIFKPLNETSTSLVFLNINILEPGLGDALGIIYCVIVFG